jgi:hypothetical protein
MPKHKKALQRYYLSNAVPSFLFFYSLNGTLMSAHPTFPTANGKYHGIGTLSLLCSEWEEVGHARMKHRHQKAVRKGVCISKTSRLMVFEMHTPLLTTL